MAKCMLCGAEVPDLGLEDHLWEYHCLSYRDYYEVITYMQDPEECWRCGTIKYPISYIHSDFPGIPCWGCITKKPQIENTRKHVFETLKELQNEIIRNKYYRHLVCFPEDLSASISHNLPETAGILDSIAKNSRRVPGKRGEVFTIKPDTLGSPLEISERNSENLVMTSYVISCEEDSPGIYEIIIRDHVYHLELPEILTYDTLHHKKYSILNYDKSARNNGRRLRIGSTDKVYKFFDVIDGNKYIKSIFRVQEKVRPEDRNFLKDIILSNKIFTDIIKEVYNELLKFMVGVYDRIFFKNYIRLSPPSISGNEIEFSWDTKETSKDNIITILIWS